MSVYIVVIVLLSINRLDHRSVIGGQTATMSFSPDVYFGGHSNRGDTICVVPNLSSDFTDDDFDLNKSYPCTQKPLYRKKRLALQRRYYPSTSKGMF